MKIDKLVRFTKFPFHVFDRNEIHIQAFVDFIGGQSMSGHSSSSTFHDFIILSYSEINKSKKRRFRKKHNLRLGTQDFHKIEVFRFSDIQNSYFQKCSHIFLYCLKGFGSNWEGYGSNHRKSIGIDQESTISRFGIITTP